MKPIRFWGTAVGVIVVSLLSVTAYQYKLNNTPVAYPTAAIPDAAKFGHPQEAIERSAKLLEKMRAVNWDVKKVPWEDKLLPDRYMSEEEGLRNDRTTTYAFPGADPSRSPESDEIAFYTNLYARGNPASLRGDRIRTKPTGFYIVGWKSGKITTVPIQDVRVIRGRNAPMIEVFPGMKAYSPNEYRVASVEFANEDGDTAKAKAYFKYFRATDDHPNCPTCDKQ